MDKIKEWDDAKLYMLYKLSKQCSKNTLIANFSFLNKMFVYLRPNILKNKCLSKDDYVEAYNNVLSEKKVLKGDTKQLFFSLFKTFIKTMYGL